MPDLLAEALALAGFGWIVFAAFVAGLVRGFAGFGAAMIYLPIAALFLSPVTAIVSLMVMDCFGPLPALSRARRDAHWPDLRKLMIGMIIALPFGVALLQAVSPDVFRYAVSIMSLILLGALVLGLRYTGQLDAPKVYGVGGAGGLLGGAIGLPGPPVILFYMASPHAPAVIRATMLLFLFAFDLGFVGVVALQGMVTPEPLVLGLLLAPITMFGTLIGTWLFRPGREDVYRGAAYMIIGISALRGLPLWG